MMSLIGLCLAMLNIGIGVYLPNSSNVILDMNGAAMLDANGAAIQGL